MLYTQKPFKWVEGPIHVLGVDITHDKQELLALNFNAVLKKVDNVIDAWNNRQLSLEGKIVTVNVLMSSQFVYKLACLNSPAKDICDKYRQKITGYIWEGKTPKIAFSKLTCNREQGGLKLVDLLKKDRSMKIKWISRLKNSESLANIAYYFLPDIGEKVWECNLHPNDVPIILTKESFWRDVLTAWCHHNYECKTDLNAVLKSVIWFNSDILVNRKPIFYKKWFQKGIVYIKDLVDDNYNFLTYNALCIKYNLNVPFTSYWGIIDAIDNKLKGVLKGKINPGKAYTCNYEKMLHKQLGSRFYYMEFIKDEQPTSDMAEKWGNMLNRNIPRDEICKILKNIKITTLSTKLRSFQLRLLHCAITTNEKLFKWKILDSDKCTFCNISVETVIHLIWECPVAKHIWNQIETWVKNRSNRTLNIRLENIVFCKFAPKPLDWVNTLCLTTTQYLYSCRCLKVIPNFACLKQTFLDMHSLEKYIAIKNNKLKKHEIKWNNFKI